MQTCSSQQRGSHRLLQEVRLRDRGNKRALLQADRTGGRARAAEDFAEQKRPIKRHSRMSNNGTNFAVFIYEKPTRNRPSSMLV